MKETLINAKPIQFKSVSINELKQKINDILDEIPEGTNDIDALGIIVYFTDIVDKSGK